MRFTKVWLAAALFLICSPNHLLAEAPKFAEQALELTELVLDQHIHPPTRQEMLLNGMKGLYAARKQDPPRQLSRQISRLQNEAAMLDFLSKVAGESQEDQQASLQAFKVALLSALPGGGQLIPGEENRIRDQIATNRYVGVGIALGIDKDLQIPTIPRVIYDGPAFHAGVKKNDHLLEIDGESTKGKPMALILKELRGPAESEVSVVVQQPGVDSKREMKIKRRRVFIPSIQGLTQTDDGRWTHKIQGHPDIAYLRMTNIGPSTLHELKKIEVNLLKKKKQGLIIDLRFGGGLLHDTIMVADALIDDGPIGIIDSLTGSKSHRAKSGAMFAGIPVAVLVSRRTSSGNVFLAAALQDNQRALIVGEPTISRSYVRSIVKVPESNDRVVIATGLLKRGNGTPLFHATGDSTVAAEAPSEQLSFVKPDHFVVPIRSNGKPGPELVLRRAIDVLEEKLKASKTSSKP